MRIWLAIGGALLGARAMRLPGMVLGAGVGWGVAALLDLRNRLERLEKPSSLSGARTVPPLAEQAPIFRGERYPEMAVIDELRGSEGKELADLYDEVSGRRGNGGGKK